MISTTSTESKEKREKEEDLLKHWKEIQKEEEEEAK
jgi:hypothetical protein